MMDFMPSRHRRILLVDDNHESVVEVCLQLESIHIVTDTANSEAAAKQLFKENKPDIVLSGLCLSNAEGYNFVGWIKRESKETPVLIMSAVRPLEAEEAMHAGMVDGWLFKPFDYFELNQTIFTALGSQNAVVQSIRDIEAVK